MDHTVRTYNTLRSYNSYPLEFKYEDALIVFSRLYNLWNKPLRTRCDYVELEVIKTPKDMLALDAELARSFEIFHN